jgi:hypothetical protein
LGDSHFGDEQTLGGGGREILLLQRMVERIETVTGFAGEDDDARDIAAGGFRIRKVGRIF